MNGNSLSEQGAMFYSVEDLSPAPGSCSQISPGVSGLWFEPNTAKATATSWSPANEARILTTGSRLERVGSSLADLELVMAEHKSEHRQTINKLYSKYVFEGARGVEAFLETHLVLASLLLEVSMQIDRWFGPNITPHLSLSKSGEEGPILRASIPWSGQMAEAEKALEAFDDSYWLENCRKAAGNLIVIYDLV